MWLREKKRRYCWKSLICPFMRYLGLANFRVPPYFDNPRESLARLMPSFTVLNTATFWPKSLWQLHRPRDVSHISSFRLQSFLNFLLKRTWRPVGSRYTYYLVRYSLSSYYRDQRVQLVTTTLFGRIQNTILNVFSWPKRPWYDQYGHSRQQYYSQ